jgi:DNA-directed RNA polymerase specialized sigma subunit
MMVTATKYSKHQIYETLKNYYWMIREIQRIDKELSQTDFSGTAQYGIEATMPKAQGIVGKALENEVVRRSNKSKKLVEYANRINYINERISFITDEKEKVVLDCLLDGLSLTGVSKHLKMSRGYVTKIRDDVVEKLAR